MTDPTAAGVPGDDLDQAIARALPELAGRPDPARRDELLTRLLARQAREVAPYGRFVAARGAPDSGGTARPDDFPALPTDAFRFSRIARHPPEEDLRVFRTSGTTSGARGAHPFRNLALYDLAARLEARRALFPDPTPRYRMLLLAPSAERAPDSSLSYMLARFADWFGLGSARWLVEGDQLDLPGLVEGVSAGPEPMALLGTSFAFVHAEDGLGDTALPPLPPGSRAMVTGGYKGRSRSVEPRALRRMIARRFGLPESQVVTEYGMTELSSQCYDRALPAAPPPMGPGGERLLVPPPWVRVSIVDPETLSPVPPGDPGLVRIDDLANVDSVAAVQTSDLGRAHPAGGGFELLGRAEDAVPRGCALALDEALAG